MSARPKGYLADTGPARAAQMMPSPFALSGHTLAGALFETAVYAELRKQAALLATPPMFWHWRTHGGAEVDLVLERDGTLYPIEVKLSSRPRKHDASGLLAFRKTCADRKVAPGLVVAPAEEFGALTDEVYVMPWDARVE